MTFFETFTITASATIQIFLMAAAGFILVKREIIKKEGLSLLTRLLINFFLPFFMFHQFTKNFNFQEYPYWWCYLLLSGAVALVGLLVSRLVLALVRGIEKKREFTSLVVFQNSGYIPLMLVTVMFIGPTAQKLYVYILIFIVGFNVMLWSLGVWLLTQHKGGQFDIKNLANPPLLSMIFSLIVIFFGIHRYVPDIILKPVGMFSDCVLPLAMIVIGGNLAKVDIRNIDLKFIGSVILAKLILLPLLALGITMALKPDFLLGFLIMVEAVVPSAITLSIIAQYYEGEEQYINQGIFFCHVASILTIPFFFEFIPKFELINHGIQNNCIQ